MSVLTYIRITQSIYSDLLSFLLCGLVDKAKNDNLRTYKSCDGWPITTTEIISQDQFWGQYVKYSPKGIIKGPVKMLWGWKIMLSMKTCNFELLHTKKGTSNLLERFRWEAADSVRYIQNLFYLEGSRSSVQYCPELL